MSPEETSEKSSTESLIADRGKVHGPWRFNASVQWQLKDVIRINLLARENVHARPLTVPQIEALDMICVKIGRIIAGDPFHADHWDDIAGYARLGRDALLD